MDSLDTRSEVFLTYGSEKGNNASSDPKQFLYVYYVVVRFNFILGLNFIFFCFKLIIIHYHTQKQRIREFKPRIKLSQHIHLQLFDYTAHLYDHFWTRDVDYPFYQSWKIAIQTAGFSVAFGSTGCRLRSTGGLVLFMAQAFKASLFQYISYCKTRLPLGPSKQAVSLS